MTENIMNNNTSNNSEFEQNLLPDFCEVRNIFIVVLLTEMLAIIFAMTVSSTTAQFWDYLSLSSLLMLWIALLNSAVLCQLRNWLNKHSQCLIISFCLMMGVSVVVALLSKYVTTSLYLNELDTGLTGLFFLRIIIISAVIYFLLLRYFYIQHQWRVNLAAQSRAEIQALQARIRPHFLFNSMNTIASLIEIAPEKAETAIEDLSDLFRASLREQHMNPLQEEIELVKSYLAIETLRLGDRLQIEWHIDKDLLDVEVPSLCLQPLAENAIYHGIEPLPKGGKIVISALHLDTRLILSVSNPLMPENSRSALKKGNQMAQENIRQRLKLVYGKTGEFSINDTKEQYTVSLTIPLDVTNECINR